jgi:hypothetical protein
MIYTLLAMTKLDLYKELKSEYVTPTTPAIVKTGKGKYLTVIGEGDPNGEIFQRAIAALYSVAYTIKMAKKFHGGVDYKVCALEGLWDIVEDGETIADRNRWRWKLMIRVPDFIHATDLRAATKQLIEKGKPEDVRAVQLEALKEGPCVQVLHVGPYSEEGPTIERMREFAASKGLEFRGLHHEIYLSDPRRTKPERLRTILRCPVGASA